MKLSKTAYMKFRESPEKYNKYMRGESEAGEKAKGGQIIHEAFENFFHYADLTGDELDVSVEDFPEHVREHPYIKENNLLRRLIDYQTMRFGTIKDAGLDPEQYFVPYSVEEKFVSGEHGIYGYVDAIFKQPDGWMLFDLKSEFYDDHKKEMEFYKILVDDATPDHVEMSDVMVLSLSQDVESGKNPKIWNESELDIDDRKLEIERIRRRIVNDNELETPGGGN